MSVTPGLKDALGVKKKRINKKDLDTNTYDVSNCLFWFYSLSFLGEKTLENYFDAILVQFVPYEMFARIHMSYLHKHSVVMAVQ